MSVSKGMDSIILASVNSLFSRKHFFFSKAITWRVWRERNDLISYGLRSESDRDINRHKKALYHSFERIRYGYNVLEVRSGHTCVNIHPC